MPACLPACQHIAAIALASGGEPPLLDDMAPVRRHAFDRPRAGFRTLMRVNATAPTSWSTPWLTPGRIRRFRLYAGLVLFVFVCTHLLNHALGLISLQAMEAGRWLFLAVWRNPVGSALLICAVVVHLLLAFWSIYQRRHLRMPSTTQAVWPTSSPATG